MRLPRRALPSALLIAPALLAAGAALYARQVWRFRDPVRLTPAGPDLVVSPADGVVSFVRRADLGQVGDAALALGDLLGTPQGSAEARAGGWVVGIAIRPFDVHYTYQPTGGTVTERGARAAARNRPLTWGQRLPLLAGHPVDLLPTAAVTGNEREAYTLASGLGEVTVTQIGSGTGLHLRSFMQPGMAARAGNKASFLPEGGVVVVHWPDGLTPAVQVGDVVRGGETVVARRPEQG